MARPKKVTIDLRDLADCNRALGELRESNSDIQTLTADRDRAVAAAQAKFEPALDEAKKAKASIEAALEAYYYAHLAELEKEGKKRVQLANGVMGRRDNPPALKPLNRKWKWEAIEAAVKAWAGNGWRKFFRVPDPTLDKQALKDARLAIEKLKELGLKLEAEESFYAEPATLPAPSEVQGGAQGD